MPRQPKKKSAQPAAKSASDTKLPAPGEMKRTPDQKAYDLAIISELLLKGWKQKDIAVHLNRSEPTISRDIQTIRETWANAPVTNVMEARARIQAGLELIRAEAYAEMEASRTERKKVKVRAAKDSEGGEGQALIVDKTTEQRNADPRYMKIIADTYKIEAVLLGANAPTQLEHSGPGGGPINVHNVEELSDQELAAIVKQAQNARSDTDAN